MIRRIFFSLFLIGGLLSAQTTDRADLSSLPKDKQLEILQQVEAAKKATSGGSITTQSTPEQVSKWLGLGKEVAELIPVFAEKTGIAADKVLNSFSGKVLLSIVLVHFFWNKLIAILLLTVGVFVWWQWFKRLFLRDKCEQIVHPNPVMAWFGFTKTLVSYKPLKGLNNGDGGYATITDVDTVWLVVAGVTLGAILITAFIMI
jgi:hypothetical protein